MRAGRLRRLAVILAVGLLTAAVGGGAIAYRHLPALAEKAIRDRLAGLGLTAVELRVEALGPRRALVADVAVGKDPAQRLSRLTLAYSLPRLLAGRIDRIEAEGLSLILAVSPDGRVSLGPLDSLMTGGGGGGQALAIADVVLRDARVRLDHPDATVTLALDGEGGEDGEGGGRAELRFTGAVAAFGRPSFPVTGGASVATRRHGIETARVRVDATAPPLPFITARSARLAATLADGIVGLDAAIEAVEGRISARVETPADRSAFDRLRARGRVDVDLRGVRLDGAAIDAGGALDVTAADGHVTVSATAPLVIQAGGDAAPMRLVVPATAAPVVRLALAERPLLAHLSIPAIEVEAAGRAVAIEDLDGAVTAAPAPSVEVRTATVRLLGKPALVAPLGLSGSGVLDGERVRFAGRVTAALGRLALAVTGWHDFGRENGRADLSLAPVRLQPGALQLRDLAPAVGDSVTRASGSLSAAGPLAWGPRSPASALRIAVEDLSLSARGVRLEGVDGAVTLTRPWPPATPPGQRLTVRGIEAGVPLADGAVSFAIDRDRLLIERAGARVAGGELAVGPLAVGADGALDGAEVRLSGVDLAEVMRLAALDDVSGEGRLGGRIPLSVRDGDVVIAAGRIAAEGPGVLRYTPVEPPSALQGAGEGGSLMLAALRDFRYEDLRLDMNRAAGGAWDATLHLVGRNPDVMQGRLFEFNVSLTGVLDAVLRRALGAGDPRRLLGPVPGARP